MEQVKQLTAGLGASIFVETTGVPGVFPEGLNLHRADGKYLILGLYSGNATVRVDPVRIKNFNLHIIGSLGIDVDSYKKTVDIATEHGRRFQFADFITHRFPLDRPEEAIHLVGEGTPIKAVSMLY